MRKRTSALSILILSGGGLRCRFLALSFVLESFARVSQWLALLPWKKSDSGKIALKSFSIASYLSMNSANPLAARLRLSTTGSGNWLAKLLAPKGCPSDLRQPVDLRQTDKRSYPFLFAQPLCPKPSSLSATESRLNCIAIQSTRCSSSSKT